MIIMDDIEGKRPVIAMSASADEFDAFLSRAQEVVDTAEWGA